jgi:hypothetical protein
MRIYVEILTPGNGKKYEIVLDDKSNIAQAKERIVQEIIEFESDSEPISLGENLLLYSMEDKRAVPDYKNVRLAGIKSGQTLLLI